MNHPSQTWIKPETSASKIYQSTKKGKETIANGLEMQYKQTENDGAGKDCLAMINKRSYLLRQGKTKR